MTPESVMALGTEAMKVALALAALLLAALISGRWSACCRPPPRSTK